MGLGLWLAGGGQGGGVVGGSGLLLWRRRRRRVRAVGGPRPVGTLAPVRSTISLLVIRLSVAVSVISGLPSVIHRTLGERVSPLVPGNNGLTILVELLVRGAVHWWPRAVVLSAPSPWVVWRLPRPHHWPV